MKQSTHTLQFGITLTHTDGEEQSEVAILNELQSYDLAFLMIGKTLTVYPVDNDKAELPGTYTMRVDTETTINP